MRTTRYFEEQVLRKRPYIRCDWCELALRESVRREVQPDGRVRYWIFIAERKAYLRVVTLADMVTVHNAFFDRNFKGEVMKVHYYQETDSLYIDLSQKTGVDSREVAPGVVLDLDAAGQVVGIDIDHASKIVDLSKLEAEALPLKS